MVENNSEPPETGVQKIKIWGVPAVLPDDINESERKRTKTGKEWLLLLLKIILAPFLFVMSCFPVGFAAGPQVGFCIGGLLLFLFLRQQNWKIVWALTIIVLLVNILGGIYLL